MLFGRNQHLVPCQKFLDDSIPLTDGIKFIVDINIDPQGTTNNYIDRLTSLTVDIEGTDNLVQCNRVPLLKPLIRAHTRCMRTSPSPGRQRRQGIS